MNRIAQFYKNSRKELGFCMAAVFGWGMAAHGYMFLDNNVSHDSLNEFHAEILGNSIKMGSGRIFTSIYRDLLGNDVTLPWLAGLMSLIWIGLAVFLVTRLFQVKSRTTICLIAGIFATNIAVSATAATYIHDLDSYMFSMLCAVAAVYLWKCWKYGWLLGAGMLALSIGIYQAYLFVAIGLVMIDCIMRLLRDERFASVVGSGLKAIGMILLGGGLYYASMRGLLHAAGATLVKGDYNSMDLILYQSPMNILRLLGGAYADWFKRLFYAGSAYPGVLVKGITLLFFAVVSIGVGAGIARKEMGLWERLLLLALLGLLPLGTNLICAMMIRRNHDLMSFSVFLFYLLALLIGDWLKENGKFRTIGCVTRNLCALLMAVLLFGNVRFSNGLYLKKDLEYDAYLSLMTRVVGRLEAEEGYIPGETPVIFVGTPDNRIDIMPGFKDYWDVIGMISTDVIYTPEVSRYRAYFDYVMGLPICLADQELWNTVSKSTMAQQMPCYPAEGCLQFQDGVLVMKLGQIVEHEAISYYDLPDAQ